MAIFVNAGLLCTDEYIAAGTILFRNGMEAVQTNREIFEGEYITYSRQSTQYILDQFFDSVGKIHDSRPPGQLECMDGKFTTSYGQGACSWHGGYLMKSQQYQEADTGEIIEMIETLDPETEEVIDVEENPVIGVYRFSTYTTNRGKTDNSIEVQFFEKPDREILDLLKSNRGEKVKFWWNRDQAIWIGWDKESNRDILSEIPLVLEGDEIPVLTKTEARQLNLFPEKSYKHVVVKFRKQADDLEQKIYDKYNPATASQNPTRRRAGIIRSMQDDGDRLTRIQTILRAIADAFENKTIPDSLKDVSSKSQIEQLIYGYYPTTSKHLIDDIKKEIQGKRGSVSIINNFPYYPVNKYHVEVTPDQLENIEKGVKMALKTGGGYHLKNAKSDIADYKRLFKLGIYNDNDLQATRNDLLALEENYGGGITDEELNQRALTDKVNQLIGRKIPGYFNTPPLVIKKLLSMINIYEGDRILEPSAGAGDIADAIRESYSVDADVIEIDPSLREILELKGYDLVAHDFLDYDREYDVIVMNPPFEKLQDIDHVRHAFDLLADGGRLVSVMSESPFFRKEQKAVDFREFVEAFGYSERLPEGSFRKSRNSTGVNTRVVYLEK